LKAVFRIMAGINFVVKMHASSINSRIFGKSQKKKEVKEIEIEPEEDLSSVEMSLSDKIRAINMSIDVLDWSNFTDINCILDNQLGVFHFNGKPLRGIFACLLVRGKELDKLAAKMETVGDNFFPPSEDIVKEVKLILVRVKNTRFCLLREPLCLSKCVVSQGDGEFEGWVEINEITTKNTYYLQGLDKTDTVTWLKALQAYSLCVGQWRRRRGALANIVMNGMLKHL